MRIGIAGTGKMGTAMGKRLLSTGHELSVWNRTADRAKPLVAEGARACATAAQLAREADIVISIVTDGAALDDVYFGADGLLAGVRADSLFVDMSTVAPDKQQAVGRRALESGARYLECPVGGSVGPASQGKLLGFVGGDAADLERARPVLEQLCRRIEHVGGFGAGATMKLAINLPLMVYWQTFSEAMSLVQPLGLDPARVVDIFSETSGGPNMLKVRGPMMAKALAGTAGPEVSVDVATMRKDVATMLAEGAKLGYRLPVTALVHDTLAQAGAAGLDGVDCTQVPVWWLKEAGRS
jgi:3-hydroxyisobutyrate dehydrogenase